MKPLAFSVPPILMRRSHSFQATSSRRPSPIEAMIMWPVSIQPKAVPARVRIPRDIRERSEDFMGVFREFGILSLEFRVSEHGTLEFSFQTSRRLRLQFKSQIRIPNSKFQ